MNKRRRILLYVLIPLVPMPLYLAFGVVELTIWIALIVGWFVAFFTWAGDDSAATK
ncbi:MAG: hypothetical protein ACRCYU_06595 [Nocardioides sp.]